MRLRELQREMQRDLLGETSGIGAAIVDAPPLPADARLAIYRNAYRSRLIEALDDTYPVLHKLLGDETFAGLAELFIDAYPSVHRSIRWYGGELADLMSGCSPFDEQPILSEVARFEWTLSLVFDSPDLGSIDRTALKALAAEDWAGLTLRFHPSVRRLEFHWNTIAVWKAMQSDVDPPEPEGSQRPVPWLLWRRDLENYFRSMDAVETAALDAALAGRTFAEICEDLTAHLTREEIPLRAATLVASWADSGIIVAYNSVP